MKTFDCVLINPPYQDGTRAAGASKNKTKLWPKFFELTRQLVKPDGYVGFISPTSWMSPSKESFVKVKMLTALTTTLDLQVAMFGLTQKHFPGVGVDIGAIVYQNRPYQGKTVIGKETFDLTGMSFIPKSTEAMDIRIMRKITAKKGPRFKFQHLSTASNYNTVLKDSGKYAWLPSVLGGDITYSNTKPPVNAYHGVPKIHMTRQTDKRQPKFTIDLDGQYAVRHDGQIHKMDPAAIMSDRILTNIFNHKLVKFMMRNQWTQYVEPKIASLIPITDQDLYDYFDLTQEERNYINDQVK